MVEVDIAGPGSFIGAWYLDEPEICDQLITYFNESPDRGAGQIGDGQVDPEIKDSTDLHLGYERFNDPAVFRYLGALTQVCQEYVQKYQACAALDAWGITERVNIQYYKPSGGYKIWHCERWGKSMPSAARHLVFMTYLNDVTDAGGTEFLYQNVTVQPRKGLTLIWPADWTHHHRGIVSPTEEKYIITGWFSFM